jgi:hypothetical protein
MREKKDIRKEVIHTMKEKYEKPDITEQEKLEATSGANDMMAYDPYLGFHPGNVPYTGGNEASFTGPLLVVVGAVVAAGGSLVGWLTRRGAREASRNEER